MTDTMVDTPAHSAVRERGATLLDQVQPRSPQVAEWKAALAEYRFSAAPEHPDDPFVWLTCILALDAVNRGNYGVGSVIVRDGRVLAEGNNRLLQPYMRTDHHAEMVALDAFEDAHQGLEDMEGFILYSSLECCPMCTTRLINAGIRTVLYAAEDLDCGMVHMIHNLPPFWNRMLATRVPRQHWGRPACAPRLVQWAADIFWSTETELSETVRRR
jgi:tRNA(Arg) A34 adenosine deaminase TadA